MGNWEHKVNKISKVIRDLQEEKNVGVCFEKLVSALEREGEIFEDFLNYELCAKEDLFNFDDFDDLLLDPLYDYANKKRIWLGIDGK